MALSAAAVDEEEVGGLREDEEEEELGSRTARRSQRHEGQKPVKCSSGWRSQEVEGLCGCGGSGGSAAAAGSVVVLGFITTLWFCFRFRFCSCYADMENESLESDW